MKEVEDATLIRSRLLRSFERAEIETDAAERAAHLTFVIVGGGPDRGGARRRHQGARGRRDPARLSRGRHAPRARDAASRPGRGCCRRCSRTPRRARSQQLQALGVEVRLGQPVTAGAADGRGGRRRAASAATTSSGPRACGRAAGRGRSARRARARRARDGAAGLLGARPSEGVRDRRCRVPRRFEAAAGRCPGCRRARCRWGATWRA